MFKRPEKQAERPYCAAVVVAAGSGTRMGADKLFMQLGGCTVIMFGAIIVSGVTMLGECGFDQRNTIIAATSFAIGIGVTQVPEFFSGMPQIISDIFAGNPVAGVFVVAMILSLTLPKKVKIEEVGALTEETIERKPDETN